jgi:hypothetical protein
LTAVSCGRGIYRDTYQNLCQFQFPRDRERYQICLGQQVSEAASLHSKLVYYNITDTNGTPLNTNRVEYKIFKQCWIRNHPNFTAMNYCFDYWLDEYERTGRWGINSPAWQW